MSFLDKFSTSSGIKCLITGNDNNSLEYGVFRLDKRVITDANTGRSWTVQSPPVMMNFREQLKPGEYPVYLLDDDEGSSIRLERLDDGKIRTKLDSRSVRRIINDTKILDLMDTEVSKKQLMINLIMGFIVGGLTIGFFILVLMILFG